MLDSKSSSNEFQSIDVVSQVAKDEATTPDPFDPERLRLSLDDQDSLTVNRIITTVPVRKPLPDAFVRTHREEVCRMTAGVLEMAEEREVYLVTPNLVPTLSVYAPVTYRLLVTSITRNGDLFLWPAKISKDGRTSNWNNSALAAIEIARQKWIRVTSNQSLGAYDIHEAAGNIPEPVWPNLSFREILTIAFKDKLIDSIDHPVLRRLRGEI